MELDLSRQDITELLHRWNEGDELARNAVFGKVYKQLCAAAQSGVAGAHNSAVLSLVHEAFLHLSDAEASQYRDRNHFAGVCVRTMRNLLVDLHRRSVVRRRYATGDDLSSGVRTSLAGVAKLDILCALAELSEKHELAADAITLQIWGGLDTGEIAAFNACSVATIGRQLQRARFFLATRLHEYQMCERD